MQRTRNGFYNITKEKIFEQLSLPAISFDSNGFVLIYPGWAGPVEIRLTDLSYVEHPFVIPNETSNTQLGSRAEVRSESSADVDRAYVALNRQIGQFQLSLDQLRVPQFDAARVRLLIDQQIAEILRQRMNDN